MYVCILDVGSIGEKVEPPIKVWTSLSSHGRQSDAQHTRYALWHMCCLECSFILGDTQCHWMRNNNLLLHRKHCVVSLMSWRYTVMYRPVDPVQLFACSFRFTWNAGLSVSHARAPVAAICILWWLHIRMLVIVVFHSFTGLRMKSRRLVGHTPRNANMRNNAVHTGSKTVLQFGCDSVWCWRCRTDNGDNSDNSDQHLGEACVCVCGFVFYLLTLLVFVDKRWSGNLSDNSNRYW